MSDRRPLVIADSCIGGLSVLKSIRGGGGAMDVEFLADYAVNPLGVTSDAAIAEVASTWLAKAAQRSETLVIGCNTLSIRYHQLERSQLSSESPERVVSMVDCMRAMIAAEADRLRAMRIVIIGTAFTASQSLYGELFEAALPGTPVATVAATELERRIARFQPWDEGDVEVITVEIRKALENADVAVLACTCFPMAKDQLKALFPEVDFLDPGAYCLGLLDCDSFSQNGETDLIVTGEVVSPEAVEQFAESYLQQFG